MSESFPTVAEIQAMTRKQVVSLPSTTIRAIMKDPERAQAFSDIINTAEGQAAVADVLNEIQVPVVPEEVVPVAEPTDDEKAAAAIQQAEADRKIEEARVAEEARKALDGAAQAEAAALATAGITITKDAAGNIIKIVKKYQATDENKEPLGHPTYLEAKSWAELSNKQEAAHTNALRLAERIRKQKVTFKQPTQNALEPLTDEQIKDYIKIFESEPKTSAKFIEAMNAVGDNKLAQAQIRERAAADSAVVTSWMRSHLYDFKPNEANSAMLTGYLRDNNLDYTRDNLEVAFLAVQDQLTGVESPSVSTEPENETPVTPVVVTPVATAAEVLAAPAPVQVSLPVAAAPVAPAPVIQQAPARRPGVSGGIQPGSLTAPRLEQKAPTELTKKDVAQIAKNPKEFRRRMAMEPGFTDAVNKALRQG